MPRKSEPTPQKANLWQDVIKSFLLGNNRPISRVEINVTLDDLQTVKRAGSVEICDRTLCFDFSEFKVLGGSSFGPEAFAARLNVRIGTRPVVVVSNDIQFLHRAVIDACKNKAVVISVPSMFITFRHSPIEMYTQLTRYMDGLRNVYLACELYDPFRKIVGERLIQIRRYKEAMAAECSNHDYIRLSTANETILEMNRANPGD